MKNHFIGGELSYRVLNENKKASPLIGLSLLTEIASNYRGKYIRNYGPHGNPKPHWDNYIGNGSLVLSHYDSDYYVSTPLIGSVVIGCDVQLTRGLNFSVTVGYGFKIMKTRYKIWEANQEEPESNLSNKYGFEDGNILHCIDFQMGVSYSFPLKKKRNEKESSN